MAALPHLASTGSLPAEEAATLPQRPGSLWLAVQILDPPPDQASLASLAEWAACLTSLVVLRPGEGILLEIRGSLRYFSGIASIRAELAAELARREWTCRLATAPTPLAASWLVRHASADVAEEGLAGAIGRLPLAVTAWPEKVQLALRQMGLRSIADCLRLPRAGFARRLGRAWLDELDRALGRQPDPRAAYKAPSRFGRLIEFTTETRDRAVFAEALDAIAVWLERELRQQQMQIREIELAFRHLRADPTLTRIRFVDPVHERARILGPLQTRIERLALSEPAIALSLETGLAVPLEADMPELLPAASTAGTVRSLPEFALVECLRGRFGARRVYGIGAVAEHRPEHAWQRWIDRPAPRIDLPDRLPDRPLWLLPEPKKRCLTPVSDTGVRHQAASDAVGAVAGVGFERIESGWWDGRDVRRDYHVVVGAAGEKLWFYRDCVTRDWYLHGIFG